MCVTITCDVTGQIPVRANLANREADPQIGSEVTRRAAVSHRLAEQECTLQGPCFKRPRDQVGIQAEDAGHASHLQVDLGRQQTPHHQLPPRSRNESIPLPPFLGALAGGQVQLCHSGLCRDAPAQRQHGKKHSNHG